MSNIESFISEGFLQEFVETFPRDFFSEDFLPNIELYQFLNKHTDIIIGGRKEDYSKLVQTDGLTRNLIDRYLQGDDSVKIVDWNIETISDYRKLFKYFFLSSSLYSLNSQLNNLGYPTYQINDYTKLKQIIGYNATVITSDSTFPNRLQSWDILKQKLLPFNSIVVVDNYLFYNPRQINSTISMVESLLQECDNYINITFIYCSNPQSINYWRRIKERIEQSSFYSSTNISVFKFLDKAHFHDRVIITNSQLIVSGNSFNNYFNTDNEIALRSPTILNLNSHACKFNENDWSEIVVLMLKTLRSVINNSDSSAQMLESPIPNPLLNW